MRKIAVLAAALMLAGCASMPKHTAAPTVNRAAKADKYAAPRAVKATPVEQPTPNQIVKKNWFPKFKVRWLHPK